MARATRSVKIRQVLGILVMLVIVIVIATKGFNDIRVIAREDPDDFWRALGQYLLNNLAAGGGDWRPPS
jgi:hypothetical protein